MTIYFPDISGFQAGVSLHGAPAVLVKATEGTGWFNPDYQPAKTRAAKSGTFFCAYHFLHRGNTVAQARYAYSHAGQTPLMVDFEPTSGSNPQIADAVAFINEYRRQGGVTYLVYLPQWYWSQLGRPSLSALSDLGMLLVSSNYSTLRAGAGWAGYGGLTPTVWQYTDAGTLNGVKVDYNVFQGTTADFKSLVTTGALGGNSPVLRQGDTGAAVTHLQTRLGAWGAKLTADGVFGTGTAAALRAFQTAHGLTADGIAGPKTWAALDKSPAPAPPVPGGYPAPGQPAVKSVSLAVSWEPLIVNDAPVTSYTVQALGKNGHVYVTEVTNTNSAVLAGLVHGWEYVIQVWGNGGPNTPAHASLKVAV